MVHTIKRQSRAHLIFYVLFGLLSLTLILFYLSNTIIHFTTDQQFPINSLIRFPLTLIIFPAEIFSLCFAFYFVYTLFTDRNRQKPPLPLPGKDRVKVALLLPVYNEPKDIVERTVLACKKVKWPGGIRIYILDDSTEASHQKGMRALAKKYNCEIVHRQDRTGYKAGNINNAIKHHVKEEFFAILDADQAPLPEFFTETMDYFSDEHVGFVQTPQHFINDSTPLERAAKIGTNIFYQAMCVSKSNDGAMPYCGTNAVTRAKAFKTVNGFSYYTATEDIDLGVRMNDKGFHGAYVPKVLALGYAPPDFKAYSSQQYRWANGNLAILREYCAKLLTGRFSLRYLAHMFFTLGWWLIGIVTLAYIIVPLLSFYLGGTHHTWLPTWILSWIYIHVLIGISMIYISLHGRTDEPVRWRDAFLEYSLITNSMFIYARAAWNALVLKRYIGFIRTSKKASASGWQHIKWNLLFAVICFSFSAYALFMGTRAADFQQFRTYLPISLWLLFYSFILFSSIVFVGKPEATA